MIRYLKRGEDAQSQAHDDNQARATVFLLNGIRSLVVGPTCTTDEA